MRETASCFVHGDFDAALRRCPECGAGRGGDTTGAAARNSRPTPVLERAYALVTTVRVECGLNCGLIADEPAASALFELLALVERKDEEVARLRRALEQISDLPTRHDLLFNAEAKALWFIARSALDEIPVPS